MPDKLTETVTDPLAGANALVDELVGDRAGDWDRLRRLPDDVLRTLGKAGLLCAEVPAEFGGLGVSSLASGQFTAHVGSHCSSLRSVMTSHGMAAWTVQRLGDAKQRAEYLPRFTGGELGAVAFSEPNAGSDLSAMTAEIRPEGDGVVLDGQKVWTTAALYADLIIVSCRNGEDAAAVVVPVDAPGVTVRPVEDASGCRAGGHADVQFDSVRLPMSAVLGGGGQPLALLVTTALAYGRISVAWGCVGILRGCLTAAGRHAGARRQFGKSLSEHQLVARHLASLFTSEQIATRACEHASRCWDTHSPDMVVATVLAKYVSATQAAAGAATAVQVMGSVAARDGHVVARAYRDAKLMELIEGTNEICQLIMSAHVVATTS